MNQQVVQILDEIINQRLWLTVPFIKINEKIKDFFKIDVNFILLP